MVATVSFFKFLRLYVLEEGFNIIKENNFLDSILLQEGLDKSPNSPNTRSINNKILISKPTRVQSQLGQAGINPGVWDLADIHVVEVDDDDILL